MKLLYSDILPLTAEEGHQTIKDCFIEQLKKSDQLKIAVGYVTRASLEELDNLVNDYNIGSICLCIGMYYIEGMPESTFHTAVRINKKWTDSGIGEIRIIKPFKYHGKTYCFYRESEPFAVIIGSPNLGVLKLEASNRRQYEIAALTTNPTECREIADFIDELENPKLSENIRDVLEMPLITEQNTALTGIENVAQVPPTNVEFYRQSESRTAFRLPLKVPAYSERHMDDGQHFTKSNINVCYAAPRSGRKSRDWFETQLTVAKDITRIDGYPEKNVPFFIITDDGYWFKAHTTSDGNKQFSAVGDELIMGRWLKGRLAASGLVTPINDTQQDVEREGMITKEMLQEYGSESLYFKKTDQTALDENGNPLDIWFLSFNPEDMKEEDE